MVLHLYLVRHAESENNARPEHQRVEDPEITPRGIVQADRLAEWLASHDFDLLVTSPFRRALQTAAPTVNRTGRPVEVWCDIYERGGCYLGWREDNIRGGAGLAGDAIIQMIPNAIFDTEIPTEGWWGNRDREADHAAVERASRVRVKMESRFGGTDQRVVMITHAEFQRILLTELIGARGIDTAVLGEICNAGISYLTFDEAGWRMHWFNSVTHMPSEHITGAKG